MNQNVHKISVSQTCLQDKQTMTRTGNINNCGRKEIYITEQINKYFD